MQRRRIAQRKKVERMKKFRAAFPVCALMALVLCAAPASALANDATDLAMSEERTELDAEGFESTEEQFEFAEEGLEFEQEQVEEVVVQNDQLIVEEEAGDENKMLGEDDEINYIGKKVFSCELKGTPRIHCQGEDLDLSGVYWLVTYDDGSVRRVNADPNATSGYDKNLVGWQLVYISQEIDWWPKHKMITVIVNPRHNSFANGVSVELSANARQAQQLERSALVAKRDSELSIDKNLNERYEVQTQPEAMVFSAQYLPFSNNRIEAVDGPLGKKLGGDFVQFVAGGAKLYAYPINSAGYEALASTS